MSDVPVIVGVGRYTQKNKTVEAGLEPIGLSTVASKAALSDCGIRSADIDAVAFVAMLGEYRIPPKLIPMYKNPSKSLANALGMDHIPEDKMFLSSIGGNMPQFLVNEMAERITKGEIRSALISGAEALATLMKALKQGYKLPGMTADDTVFDPSGRKSKASADAKLLRWGDDPGGEPPITLGDSKPVVSTQERLHGLLTMPNAYAMIEQSIRKSLKRGKDEHRMKISKLFDGYNRVASEDPENAWFPTRRDAAEINKVSKANRMIAYPYAKYQTSVMDINMAASVIIMSEKRAIELGIPRGKFVYLHGSADASEVPTLVSERKTVHEAHALKVVGEQVLKSANVGLDRIEYFDIYSCFPSAVQVACKEIGIDKYVDMENESHRLTVTGGLGFHGGPGNNYSLHGIAAMVEKLRKEPGRFGLVTANGGVLTKHSAGIYSTMPYAETHRDHPTTWVRPDYKATQKMLKENYDHPVPIAEAPSGNGTLELYAIEYLRGTEPSRVLGIGTITRGEDKGKRFLATSSHKSIMEYFVNNDPFDVPVTLSTANAENPRQRVTTFHLDIPSRL